MKKILVLLLFILMPLNVLANNIESKSAIVVNRENKDILYEKNINEKLPIASLTKIMTVLVTLENITSLDSPIIIENNDINNLDGYKAIGLERGMEVSYKDLVYSTIMYSAADSAMALANNVFDDYDKFIDKMNEKAKNLEMYNTSFSNPVGFDKDNYSTSYDLYKLLDYALKNDNFYKVFTTKTYKIESLGKSISNNINNLIENNNIEFDGYKGGYTKLSGLSLCGITNIDNNELIVITLNALSEIDSKKNLIDSLSILSYVKNNYSNRVILEKDKLIDNIIYKEGNKEINYEVRSNETIKHFMNNNLNLHYLKMYYEGKTVLDNSIKNHDEIGKIKIYYEDKLLDSVNVKFNKYYLVKKGKDYKNLLIFIGICLLGLIVFRKKN